MKTSYQTRNKYEYLFMRFWYGAVAPKNEWVRTQKWLTYLWVLAIVLWLSLVL